MGIWEYELKKHFLSMSVVDKEHIKLFTKNGSDYLSCPTAGEPECENTIISDETIDALIKVYAQNPGAFLSLKGSSEGNIHDIDEEKKSFYLLLDLLLTIPDTPIVKRKQSDIMNANVNELESLSTKDCKITHDIYYVFLAICKNVIYETKQVPGKQPQNGQTPYKNILYVPNRGKNVIVQKTGLATFDVYVNKSIVDNSPSDYSSQKMEKKLTVSLCDEGLLRRVCAKSANLSGNLVSEKGYEAILEQTWKSVAEAEGLPCVKTKIQELQLLCKRLFSK